jgi:hypothetical protein
MCAGPVGGRSQAARHVAVPAVLSAGDYVLIDSTDGAEHSGQQLCANPANTAYVTERSAAASYLY